MQMPPVCRLKNDVAGVSRIFCLKLSTGYKQQYMNGFLATGYFFTVFILSLYSRIKTNKKGGWFYAKD